MIGSINFHDLFQIWDFPIFCTLVCLAFGLAALRYNRAAKDMKLLAASCFAAGIYILCDAYLCAIQSGIIEYHRPSTYVVYMIMNLLGCVIAFLWMGIIDIFYGEKAHLLQRVFYCIATAVSIATVALYGTDLMIADIESNFDFGFFDNIWFLAQLGPLVFVLVRSIVKTRAKDAVLYREKTIPIIIVLSFQFAVSLLQIVLDSNPIIGISFALSAGMVFVYRVKSDVSRDELTGLPNRRDFYLDLNKRFNDEDTSQSHYLILFDLDAFKGINDTYGHNEGDTALKNVARVVGKVCREKDCQLYRYGGDEFIILKSMKHTNIEEEEEEVRGIIRSIEEGLKIHNAMSKAPYNLAATFGYSAYGGEYTQSDTILRVVERADKMLYQGKQEKKRARA